MIEHVVSSILFCSPLALTGNDSGLWFVGDTDPSATTFSSKPPDLDHELCERYSAQQYVVVEPFTRRPSALAVDNNTLWFIDDTLGVGMYKIRLTNMLRASTSRNASLQSSTLEGLLDTTEKPTDFLIYQGEPLLVFGDSANGSSKLLQYQHRVWNEKESLEGTNAHVSLLQDQLIAAVPSDFGVTMWYMNDGSWHGGDEVSIEGDLVDLICRDDWPILVTTSDGESTLTGIQRGGLVEIASFPIPKGRWAVSPSPMGLSVVGVERKGTTTVLDIGWPSGSISEPIVLEERFRENDTLFMTMLFVSMLVVSMILILKIRRS